MADFGSGSTNIFRQILLENEADQSYDALNYFKRSPQVSLVPKKALIFTGVRRSGKSTLMRQIQLELALTQNPFHYLHIHFFDERFIGFQAKDLNAMIEAYYEIHPEVSTKETLHLFLDEIQVLQGWELFIERQLRNPNRRVFLTGSSARLLSQEIATAMRGRSLSFEVFPFSFAEILEWDGLANRAPRAIQIDPGKVRARFKKYLLEGGFPEVVPEAPRIQKKILQEYYEVLLLRDILERHQEGNIPLVRSYLRLLLQSFSSLVTINKCHERLKSLGIKTDKSKLTEILKWAEDSYLLFPVSLFSESFSKQNANPKKIYTIDNGLIGALTTQTSENRGRLLENAVFLYFRAKGKSIHYYRTRSGYEIDFVIDEKELYQVAESVSAQETFEREIRSLEQGMAELGISQSHLIVMETESLLASNEIQTPSGVIRVHLAHEFLA